MEVLVNTRGDFRPDPELDDISAIFYSLYHDVPPEAGARHVSGIICVHEPSYILQTHKKQTQLGTIVFFYCYAVNDTTDLVLLGGCRLAGYLTCTFAIAPFCGRHY